MGRGVRRLRAGQRLPERRDRRGAGHRPEPGRRRVRPVRDPARLDLLDDPGLDLLAASSRQGAIQDSLFAEAFAVRDVIEVCDIVDGRSKKADLGEARRAIRAHAETLRDAVDGEAADGADQASLARLLGAVDEVDAAAGGGAVCARAVNAYGAAVSARSARASALASTIPPIKLYSYVIISRDPAGRLPVGGLGLAPLRGGPVRHVGGCVRRPSSSTPFGGAWSVSAREEATKLPAKSGTNF